MNLASDGTGIRDLETEPSLYFHRSCGRSPTTTRSILLAIAEGRHAFECPLCRQPLDARADLMWHLGNDHRGFFAYRAVGASCTTFKTSLRPLQRIAVGGADLAIPAGGKVLSVHTQALGFPVERITFPLLVAHQQATGVQDLGQFLLVGAPFEQFAESAVSSDVRCVVHWFKADYWGIATNQLVSAIEAFAHGNFTDQVISMQTAMEILVSAALAALATAHSLSGSYLASLERAAAPMRLQSLLALVVLTATRPPLSDTVVGGLSAIRKYRNAAAHDGSLKRSIGQSEAASLLVDALAAAEYLYALSVRR